MRILVVSVSFPFPAASGGERRLAALLGGLAGRHEVGVVALRRVAPDPAALSRFSFVDLVEPALRSPIPYPFSAIRAWWGVLAGSLPGFARPSGTRAFAQAVDRALTEFRPDVVYVEPLDVAHVLPRVARAKVPACFGAIELVTPKTERWLKLVDSRKQRFAGVREIRRTRRLEEAAIRSADAVVCVSEADREVIGRWTGRDAVVAPNGVDAAEFAPIPGIAREPGLVLLLGPLTYAANLDAVEWFVRDILPHVPGVTAEVVGRRPTVSLDLGKRVRLHGTVDDVRPHLARAAALVAPLRIAGGTRLKLLEALAMRTPVVTTTIGAEGLDVRDGEHLLVADDAAAFAGAVQRLVDDPSLAERLGRAGRDLVERSFGWERSVEALEDTLVRIARPSSRAAS